LLRHFSMIWLCSLSNDSMRRIFTCIIGGFVWYILTGVL
jgi:hypothetical protein